MRRERMRRRENRCQASQRCWMSTRSLSVSAPADNPPPLAVDALADRRACRRCVPAYECVARRRVFHFEHDLPVIEQQNIARTHIARQILVGDTDGLGVSGSSVQRDIQRKASPSDSVTWPVAKRSMRIFGPCRSPSTPT